MDLTIRRNNMQKNYAYIQKTNKIRDNLSICLRKSDKIYFNLSSFIGTAAFFVKLFRSRYTRGPCINSTDQVQSSGSSGKLYFLELSDDGCLDPSAQFRFRDNGAILNLQRQGCLAAFTKNISGSYLDMFYLYVDSVSLDRDACAQKPNQGIYRAINQTSEGGLSVYYQGKDGTSFKTWCAKYTQSSSQLSASYGITHYLGLSTRCESINWDQKFIFGKFISFYFA